MENLPRPIDLSVPKPNSVHPTNEVHSKMQQDILRQRNPYIRNDFYVNGQPLSPTYSEIRHPFYPSYHVPSGLTMPINPSILPSTPFGTFETPSNLPVSVMDTPSPSPDSCDGSEPTDTQIENANLKINEEFGGAGTRGRYSEVSSPRSISSSNDDSNNNQKETIPRPSDTQTICSVEKLARSPQKSSKRSKNSRSPSSDDEEHETMKLPKRESVSPELLSRLGQSPASTFSNEADVCDSTNRTRLTRPFKAMTTDITMDLQGLTGPLGDYQTFRDHVLEKFNRNNKSSNHNMRRSGNSANAHVDDPTYWEKRKRNNEAAKRSRDARRRKEDEIAIRCSFLERERLLLLHQIDELKKLLEDHTQRKNMRYFQYTC